ncbi:MAG: bifunctional phosphopantothenoylcysteine decarboxylase/phosphopantothenate--cysteine ligase CoaBC [Vulcanimicrobiaceae bacterium]
MTGARVLLGVTGGIAAYKAASLTSALVQRGAIVDVIVTAEAERFVTPLTFSSLTARPVYTSLWDAPEKIPHIRLVREAQVVLVAPATANVIAKLAHGIADDLLTTALLAARVPVLIAPAMNSAMYESDATRENVAALRARGYEIVDPESGFLAERETGVGRLATEERLLDAIDRVLARANSLAGVRVAITAGPTREAFDPVRFVSNASTGATGIALAHEAAARGANVTLLLGPTLLDPPPFVNVVRFETAAELRDAALKHAAGADVVIAAAAVSDWRPAHASPQKIKKTAANLTVSMVRTPDVLATLGAKKGKSFLVGFAAETDDHEANARKKLKRKHLDAIAVNDVGSGRGFGTGENALVVLWGKDGRRDLGSADKAALAARLWDAIEELRCS